MAVSLKPVDVVIVGLGGAGGLAVLPLAQAGLKVAGIEAGTWLDPHKDYRADELHNDLRLEVTSVPQAKREIPTFRTSPAERAVRAPSGRTMMNGIGGTTIHYDANSWRFHPWDFRVRSETERRYGRAAIP